MDEADLPEEVRKEVERELERLERLPSAAPDYQVTRTYLEFVLELPWRRCTEDVLDLSHAQQVLDEDHFDLEKVKERILEHLAVLKLNPEAKAPILCFVGPPGVGKTSLGQSIARALGRKFERMSLGGLHDEAELRGHRRTYIGAMPGRDLAGHPAGRGEQPGADARRGGQARPRLPRRSDLGPAGDPRPGPELDLPRQLPRPAVRPVEGLLHRHGQLPGRHPAAPAGSHGGPAAVGIQRGREAPDRAAIPGSPATRARPG